MPSLVQHSAAAFRSRAIVASAFMILLSGCVGVPTGVTPVQDFELDAYLGTWYEIARLDHRFERGLEQVSATYRRREGGGVDVLNRGYNASTKTWKQAQGRASFVSEPNIGHLKVSFFGPFYGSYIVFEQDPSSASHAFVSGPNRSYLWLLARERQVPRAIAKRFVELSASLGYDVEQLIWVKQDSPPAVTP